MRRISRRDLIHGTASLPLGMLAGQARAGVGEADYPPEKTGLRGSHEGSFEVAHALGREGQTQFGPVAGSESGYDLIVVGGGVSGLSAAYFYRQKKPDARILILENHDDFGGHAKRNEFTVDGTRLIGYGGSQTMEAPSRYGKAAKTLLRELAVDLDAFDDAYDQDFYRRNGLRGGLFFDRETYGKSAFVATDLVGGSGFLGLASPGQTDAQAVLGMPISEEDKYAFLGLLAAKGDALPQVSLFDLAGYLQSISYETFLTKDLGVDSAVVANILRDLAAGYFGVGADAFTALEGLAFGLPGINRLGVPAAAWLRSLALKFTDRYIHHFPDGNASIARLLVRSLIPELSTVSQPARLVSARFDYALLDKPDHNVRLRLNSTAVNVRREGGGVAVDYVTSDRRHSASARRCVLACYNMMIPHLCPELPDAQKRALAEQVKTPLVYTNVAIRNWRSLAELGVGAAFSPNMFHQLTMVDFPVSIGDYQFSPSPDDPVVLHMSTAFNVPGLPPKAQFRAGRALLLGTPFATIETNIRNHLDQMLGPGGFDAGRDIAAITVNRWPHGYAYGYYSLFDPPYPEGQAPHEIGRRTWGPIAIANSDAGARAYLDEAIEQGHRAVSELP